MAAAPLAAAAAPSPADCDGADWQTVLQASAGAADARAVWLDARRVQWAGPEALPDARDRLLLSAAGTLSVKTGQTAQGADASFELLPAEAAAADARFHYLPVGPRLALVN